MLKEYNINYCSYNIFCVQNIIYTFESPVLFIHGLGTSGKDFEDAFYSPWMEDKKIFTIDLLGHGRSDKPKEYSYDLKIQAQSIYSVLGQLGLEKINVVAHSMGGTVAYYLAHKHPEIIEKLIMVEGNIIPHKSKIAKGIQEYGSEKSFEDNYESFLNRFNRPDVSSAYNFYKSLLETEPYVLYRTSVSMMNCVDKNLYEQYLQLNVPKYYIAGSKSYYTITDDIQKDFAKNNIGYFLVPDATHSVMTSNPDYFYEVLYDILND